jgi:hypothetical protein
MKISMVTVVGEWWEGRKFKHPQTGHMVLFKSLPLEEQKRLNEEIKKDDEGVKPQQQKPQQKPNEVLQQAKQEISKEVSTAIAQSTGEALTGKARLVVKEIVSSGAGPFVFGFLDNFIMLVAGASIDSALGSLGFGATALAGIGNTISDTVSKASEESLDNLMDKVGFSESKEGQALSSKEKKVVRSMGGVAGITMGCIAGMIPMLFGVKLGARYVKAQEDMPDFETMLSIVQKKVGEDKFKEIFKSVLAKVGTALDKVFKEKALNQASAYVDKAKDVINSVGQEKGLKTLYEQIRDY